MLFISFLEIWSQNQIFSLVLTVDGSCRVAGTVEGAKVGAFLSIETSPASLDEEIFETFSPHQKYKTY